MQTRTDSRIVSARVPTPLADGFALAAELDGVSPSAALRSLMKTYIEAVAAPLNDGNGRAPERERARTDQIPHPTTGDR